jgi:ribosome-associated protein
MIYVTPSISLSEDEIDEKFIRSPGPGGQNVNKVETGVQLRFDVKNSPSLTEYARRRLTSLAGQRLTREGMIVITANRYRSQDRNRKDAVDRLVELIRQAAAPTKSRRPTRPSLGAKRKRLDTKKKRGSVKKMRGRVDDNG